MSLNTFQANLGCPIAGLGTSTFNVITAGLYTLQVQCNLPASSGLQIVVNQNGSPVLTIGGAATNPTPTQPAIGSSIRIQAAAADVLTVVLSSANAVDSNPNAVKGLINLYQGY